MPVQHVHPWKVTTAEARAIQLRLAGLVSRENEVSRPKLVAGVDISAPRFQGKVRGTVVVLSCPDLEVVEIGAVEQTVDFPYIPGLLSFRESPVILAAYEKLRSRPDLVMVDGQGIAHPRRFGLASHLGVLLDVPTIGCAKSLLCGLHDALGAEAGSAVEIEHEGEVVGMALRTKTNVKPVFVSIGHKVDLTAAVSWVRSCCRGYRLPEPTRLAHQAASGNLRM
ncbi:MAG: deoxyribonuclease V [Dehalococcoidia bacterium]|nr:deoxyribonuclease V [Dehalococcoidia bacterium]